MKKLCYKEKMERIFKCADCGKRLELHDIHTIPGKEIVDPFTGVKWGTGKRFCAECYRNNTSESMEVWKEKETRISELKLDSDFRKIKVVVTEKVSEEKKLKYGKELTLGKFKVKDESGEIILTLWDNDINRIKKDDILIIGNGYVREFMNEKHLTLGRDGRLTVLK